MGPTVTKIIKDSWKQLGFKIRPLGRQVWVRTNPPEETWGGLIVKPPKLASFYGELPHQVTIYGYVIAAGSEATVKVGDQVCFGRLYFARWLALVDKTMIGYLKDSTQLTGYWSEIQ